MIRFETGDPFPLLEEGTHSYAEEQDHASLVDAWLGLQVEPIEHKLVHERPLVSTPTQTTERNYWVGLPVRSMLTPYTEIRTILARLNPKPGSTLIDLGAGYGRMAFVIGRHYPQVNFIGYEVIEARVRESHRCLTSWNYPLVQMQQADLAAADFKLPNADYYFIYDYGSREAISKTMNDLKTVAQSRAIKVIGRGGLSRNIIDRENPWLSQVHAVEHFHHYSIYNSGDR